MIQRIQTLYLLLVAVAYSLLFYFPLNIMVIEGQQILELNIWGLYEQTIQGNKLIAELYPPLILTILAIGLNLTSIFLYKKRKIQMKLIIYAAVISLGVLGISIFNLYKITEANNTGIGFSIGLILPLIAFILQVLAYKSVLKDELLIKSINRIR